MAALAEQTVPLWLPDTALECDAGSARLRSWLTEPGLLTHRMRTTCGPAFHMNVLGEFGENSEHVREIELCANGVAWVFAQTRVPALTLAQHGWLAHIGNTALGEALAAHGRVTRGEFEYGQLPAAVPLIARALARRNFPPQPLWARRSTYAIEGAPLLVQEVFFPDVGEIGVGDT